MAKSVEQGRYNDWMKAGLPPNPWDEVVERLWVGSSELAYPRNGDFGAVVSVYDWHDERDLWHPEQGTPHLVLPFLDNKDVPIAELDVINQFIRHYHGVKEQHVLVRCQAGLNRSSLAAGYYMGKELGMTAIEIIRSIRNARSEECLFNQSFKYFLTTRFAVANQPQ